MDPFWLLMLFGALGMVILFSLIFWADTTNLNYPKIKFSSFKKFYEINPSRWTLNNGTVHCRINTCVQEKFGFSYFEFLKYRSWLKKLRKQQEQEKNNASTKRMMDAVKQDIADSEAKAKKMRDDLSKIFESDNMDLLKFIEEYKKIYERKNL